MEAGDDASLETLSLVAEALRVSVRDLFSAIDDEELSSRVASLEDRKGEQQATRDRVTGAWQWLYIGAGVVLTLLSFTVAHGMVLFLGYWVGGTMILVALRRLYLEPHLDEKYPLSRTTQLYRPRKQKRRAAALAGDRPEASEVSD